VSRQGDGGTETRPATGAPEEDRDEVDVKEVTEPTTPSIDQDVAGSVNAALHDADE